MQREPFVIEVRVVPGMILNAVAVAAELREDDAGERSHDQDNTENNRVVVEIEVVLHTDDNKRHEDLSAETIIYH